MTRVIPPTTAPTLEEVDRGLWFLENARNSHELNLLDRQTLVELCRHKLKLQDDDYKTTSVMDMVIFRTIFFELLVFFTFTLLTLHFAY